MIGQHALLVTLVEVVDRLPTPQAPENRRPGRPRVYTTGSSSRPWSS